MVERNSPLKLLNRSSDVIDQLAYRMFIVSSTPQQCQQYCVVFYLVEGEKQFMIPKTIHDTNIFNTYLRGGTHACWINKRVLLLPLSTKLSPVKFQPSKSHRRSGAFIQSFIRSFIQSFTHSFIQSFMQSFTHLYSHLHNYLYGCLHSHLQSFIQPFTVIYTFIQSFTQSFTFIYTVIYTAVYSHFTVIYTDIYTIINAVFCTVGYSNLHSHLQLFIQYL